MPPTVRRIAATVNTVYMAACIDANEWLDTTLVQSFIYGFKVVGNIDDSLVYRPIPALTVTIAEARLTQFKHNARAWNERLMTRLRAKSTADSVTAAKDLAVAQKSAKELSKAVIVGPYLSIGAIHEAMVQLHPHLPPNEVYPALLERFGVEQKGDVRAIDNGRSNGANKATNMAETVTTPSFFYVAIVARAYAVAADTNPPPPMTTTLLDLSMAYRTIPSAQPWYTTVAFYNPITKHPELYWLPGHNFGLKSAVVNFNRYPELVCIIARAQYAVVCEHYYDDFIIPDLQLGENTAQHAIEQLVLSLGPGEPRDPRRGHISSPEIDPKKTKEHNTKNTVLGIIADVGNVQHGTVSFDASADRITSVLKTFRDAFVANQLLPHEASSIRGKLFFVLSAAYAMVGRAATLTLVQRQYRDKAPFAFQDGSELHHSLLFFEALLPNLPRLVVPLVPDTTPPLLVYTDASFWLSRKRRRLETCSSELPRQTYNGALGVVVFDPVDQTVRFAEAEPPWRILLSSWQRDKKTYIAELETLAGVAAYSTYPDLFAGRKVNHFIDNTVALSALVHGYSGKPDLAKPVNIFYLQTLSLRTSVYFEYVPSKANIADLPSRRMFNELRSELHGMNVVCRAGQGEICFTSPDALAVPSATAWNAPLESWVTNPRTWDTSMPL